MSIIGGSNEVKTELTLVAITGTGITVGTGHAVIAAVSHTAANVSTNIQDVADITDPSAWTNLASLTGSRMRVLMEGIGNISTPEGLLSISIDENEDAGEDIRAQIVVDGTTVADMTVTRDAGGAIVNYVHQEPVAGGNGDTAFTEFICETSFVVRGCCEGNNFGDAGTWFKHGRILYSKLI